MIKLDGEQQESIKISQLDDLIEKHLEKGIAKGPKNGAEKSLKKVFMTLFKNSWKKSELNLTLELLGVVKQSYGVGKSVIWKFLNIVGTIK